MCRYEETSCNNFSAFAFPQRGKRALVFVSSVHLLALSSLMEHFRKHLQFSSHFYELVNSVNFDVAGHGETFDVFHHR